MGNDGRQVFGIDEECNVTPDGFGPLLRGGQGGTRQAVAYVYQNADNPLIESEVSATLRARNSTDERSNGAYVIKGTAIGFNGDQSEKTRSMGEKKEQSTTLRADGPSHVAVAFAQNQIGEVRTGDVANTINTNSNASGRNTPMVFTQNTRDEVRYINGDGQIAGALAAEPGMKQQSYVQLYHAVRRLTPKECERLQGFPDGFTRIPYRGKPASQCPDGPRYKALGNSMAVPVMRWIGEQIQRYEEITT